MFLEVGVIFRERNSHGQVVWEEIVDDEKDFIVIKKVPVTFYCLIKLAWFYSCLWLTVSPVRYNVDKASRSWEENKPTLVTNMKTVKCSIV